MGGERHIRSYFDSPSTILHYPEKLISPKKLLVSIRAIASKFDSLECSELKTKLEGNLCIPRRTQNTTLSANLSNQREWV